MPRPLAVPAGPVPEPISTGLDKSPDCCVRPFEIRLVDCQQACITGQIEIIVKKIPAQQLELSSSPLKPAHKTLRWHVVLVCENPETMADAYPGSVHCDDSEQEILNFPVLINLCQAVVGLGGHHMWMEELYGDYSKNPQTRKRNGDKCNCDKRLSELIKLRAEGLILLSPGGLTDFTNLNEVFKLWKSPTWGGVVKPFTRNFKGWKGDIWFFGWSGPQTPPPETLTLLSSQFESQENWLKEPVKTLSHIPLDILPGTGIKGAGSDTEQRTLCGVSLRALLETYVLVQ